ncbi:MAG: tRNA (guanosine(37)-N1)-methyltransferase TrmD [Chloroflexi bacterium]|nr:tRNA (guanosine(37)-N1)-methyltransferase TrmD [Chloroflexota bacterium]
MRFDILTIFPAMFAGPFDESIVKRAQKKGLVSITIHNIRDYARDKHRSTDDYPYGGGVGMVMKPEPIFDAIEAILATISQPWRQAPEIILLSPSGRPLTQSIALQLAQREHIIFICGRYEGVDERVREHLATDDMSIGDYVLSGGEIPAMVIVDAVTRLVPGVLGAAQSAAEESFAQGLLEYPQYTRPPDFRGWQVPEILLSGNHAAIARWRREQSLLRTWHRRPDLLASAALTAGDKKYLRSIGATGFDEKQ